MYKKKKIQCSLKKKTKTVSTEKKTEKNQCGFEFAFIYLNLLLFI